MKYNIRLNWFLIILGCIGFWIFVCSGIYQGFKKLEGNQEQKIKEPVIDKTLIRDYLWIIYKGDTIGKLELPRTDVYLEDSVIRVDNNYYLPLDSGQTLHGVWLREKDGRRESLYLYQSEE